MIGVTADSSKDHMKNKKLTALRLKLEKADAQWRYIEKERKKAAFALEKIQTKRHKIATTLDDDAIEELEKPPVVSKPRPFCATCGKLFCCSNPVPSSVEESESD